METGQREKIIDQICRVVRNRNISERDLAVILRFIRSICGN
jgi:hypothetical protein